jgi:hypothetical protein
MLHHGRDTYSYVWPRDGAFIALALDVNGHEDVARAIDDSSILSTKYKHLFACGHNRIWKKI